MMSFCGKAVFSFVGLNRFSKEFDQTPAKRPLRPLIVPSQGYGLSVVCVPEEVPNLPDDSKKELTEKPGTKVRVFTFERPQRRPKDKTTA
ncbi:hypothetical protein Nepgr_008594 [Nepenthes gracilis]|uniref:Uncharacterized protein n=1 Tax=Nepenthes gracilis TaxID=150966 RepID=A0AAD3S994_NEPGR|nr:hypothetical protein Nepgr_008594 [Nepenthes gracilis]